VSNLSAHFPLKQLLTTSDKNSNSHRHLSNSRVNNSSYRICSCVYYLHTKLQNNGTVYQLSEDYENAYESMRGNVLYNILIEFGMPMKLD